MRWSGVCQLCTAYLNQHGRQGRTVPCFRTRFYVQDERYTAGAGRAGAVPLILARRLTQGEVRAGVARKATVYYFPQITQITQIIV